MILRAEGIMKAYRTRDGILQALDGVSIEVCEGQTVGLIGASGCGKTTLASVIAGLETADAGTIELLGATCDASLRPSRRSAGFREAIKGLQMVFQNPASSFSERMRIGTAVAEGVAYRGVPRSEHDRLVRESLEKVGLPASYAQKHVWELSGGECQRAAIARAIIAQPRLLVCDEPTSALDVTVQAQVVHLLADLTRELGMSCLFISHDLALVRGLCDYVYVLDAGRVVEQGEPNAVFDDPQSAAAQRLAASAIDL